MSVRSYYTNKRKTKMKWWFVVYVLTGLYDVHGKPIKQQVRRKGFPTKKAAEEAERAFLSEHNDKGVPAIINPGITTKFIINSFIDFAKNEGGYAKGTVKNYEGYRNKHLQVLMEVPIKNLTPDFIQKAWVRKLYQAGVSDHVYNGCLKLLKRAFAYSISLKQLKVNPFEDFKPKKIRQKLRNRFSTEELKHVMDVCQKEMPEFYCIFVLACLTGMRLGEYSAIRPCDIRQRGEHFVIYVDKQITMNEYKDRTKTDTSTRIVDISDNVYDILQWHINKYRVKFNDFLFRAEEGGMIYAKWVERRFAKLLELCGYDEHFMRVHDLRGQYVDIMHLCGTPLAYTSRQVGHSNPKITIQTYTQILDELPAEANKRMDSIIFNEKDEKTDDGKS